MELSAANWVVYQFEIKPCVEREASPLRGPSRGDIEGYFNSYLAYPFVFSPKRGNALRSFQTCLLNLSCCGFVESNYRSHSFSFICLPTLCEDQSLQLI